MAALKKPVKTASKPQKPQSKAALAWADRNAHHLATQGDLQALRVINPSLSYQQESARKIAFLIIFLLKLAII